MNMSFTPAQFLQAMEAILDAIVEVLVEGLKLIGKILVKVV